MYDITGEVRYLSRQHVIEPCQLISKSTNPRWFRHDEQPIADIFKGEKKLNLLRVNGHDASHVERCPFTSERAKCVRKRNT